MAEDFLWAARAEVVGSTNAGKKWGGGGGGGEGGEGRDGSPGPNSLSRYVFLFGPDP